LDGLSFDAISAEEAMWMEHIMNRDKAPSPDGFSLAFFQSCWEILKEHIANVFHEFHARGKFERSLNVTFISLIHKKARVVHIK
jgi:hypothetical protein